MAKLINERGLSEAILVSKKLKKKITKQIQPTPKSGAADLRRYVLNTFDIEKSDHRKIN